MPLFELLDGLGKCTLGVILAINKKEKRRQVLLEVVNRYV